MKRISRRGYQLVELNEGDHHLLLLVGVLQMKRINKRGYQPERLNKGDPPLLLLVGDHMIRINPRKHLKRLNVEGQLHPI